MYVQVNAGRNVGSQPMSDETWLKFQQSLLFAVQTATGVSTIDVEIHTGHGNWAAEPEESVHVSTVNAPKLDEFGLRTLLANAAFKFGQEAIAIVFGQAIMVYGDEALRR